MDDSSSTLIFDQYCFFTHRLKLRSKLNYTSKLGSLVSSQDNSPQLLKLAKELNDISEVFETYFYSNKARDLNNVSVEETIKSVEDYVSALAGFVGKKIYDVPAATNVESGGNDTTTKELIANVEDIGIDDDDSNDNEKKEEKKEDEESATTTTTTTTTTNKTTKNNDGKIRKNLMFNWTSIVGVKRSIVSSDALVELTSVLFNLGVWYLGYSAYLINQNTTGSEVVGGVPEEKRQVVYDYLLKAAGIFKLLREKFLQHIAADDRTDDISDGFLQVLYLQSLGQAQELTIGRAMNKNSSASLVCGLATDTANIYEECKSILMSSFEDTFASRLDIFICFLNFKISLYQCVAYDRMAFQQNLTHKYGAAIATSQKSQSLLKTAQSLVKPCISNTVSESSLRNPVNALIRIIDIDSKRFIRENQVIGFETVPTDLDIQLPQSTRLAKPRDFKLPPIHQLWDDDKISLFDPSKKLAQSDIIELKVTSPTPTSPIQKSSSKEKSVNNSDKK
eukprot:gene3659-4557_t